MIKAKNALTYMLIPYASLISSYSAIADEAPIRVNADNFVQAETDLYFSALLKEGGDNKLYHIPEMTPIDRQTVIRLNRDTLYSAGVFDLDAGPVTFTLPDTKGRFVSLQLINQNHHTPAVIYDAGKHVIDKDLVGTRYVALAIRILADPNDPEDLKAAQDLQQQLTTEQNKAGVSFTPRNWDKASQDKTRKALIMLNEDLPDANFMFGKADEVKPIRHLIGSASAWGGNPEREATYLNITPEKNDGKTVHQLMVKDVPVDGFWSISLYNADGFYVENDLNAYNLNNKTAKKSADGSITVQFGGCSKDTVNCLPTPAGWNYMVRLYRPQAAILDGSWKFPVAQPK